MSPSLPSTPICPLTLKGGILTMRRSQVALTFTLIAMALTITACSTLNPTQPAEPASPLQTLQFLKEQLTQRLPEVMQQVAEQFGIPIQPNNVAYVSGPNLTIASALVANFERVKREGPDGTAVVGFVYLSLPEQARIKQVTGQRTALPHQFYTVQIRSFTGEVHLINRSGTSSAVVRLEQAHTLSSQQPQIDIAGCKVILRYVQTQRPQDSSPIKAAVPLDWCQQ